MQTKTEGIIIHQLKYSESARIVDIFTSEYGKTTYLIRNVGSKKAKIKAAHLQPLTLVELEVNHRNNRDIQYIKELRIKMPLHSIQTHPVKNSISIFISEVLRKSLQETEQDKKLFSFLEKAITELERCGKGMANFHLVFMAQLSHYLGFAPNLENSDSTCYFDLQEGIFTEKKPLHQHFLDKERKELFVGIMQINLPKTNEILFNRQQRNKLLENLCEYYQLHIPTFHSIKSIDVLKDIFE